MVIQPIPVAAQLSQLGAIISTMEILKIPLLPQESEREFKNSDEDLRELGAILQSKRYANAFTGIDLTQTAIPIRIIIPKKRLR